MEKKEAERPTKIRTKKLPKCAKKKIKKSFDNYFKSRYVNVKKRGNQFKA